MLSNNEPNFTDSSLPSRNAKEALIQPTSERFPAEVETVEEALVYYHNRATQLLASDWKWSTPPDISDWGVHVEFNHPIHQTCHSLFIIESAYNQGHATRWITQHPDAQFFVLEDCVVMKHWLAERNMPAVLAKPYEAIEYKAIEKVYGMTKASRSGLYYMNHIDEGLFILNQIGATDLAKRAYCIHPLMQADTDLKESMQQDYIQDFDREVLILAMEYRNIANLHLSQHTVTSIEDIALSPLEDVSAMLIADKIQNRKDFDAHHLGRHRNSDRLAAYFNEWFERLGITEKFYQECCQSILERTGSQWIAPKS